MTNQFLINLILIFSCLLHYSRSLKHLQLEQLHSLQRRAEGKDGLPDLSQIFRVLEQPDSSDSPGPSTNHPNDYLNDQGMSGNKILLHFVIEKHINGN